MNLLEYKNHYLILHSDSEKLPLVFKPYTRARTIIKQIYIAKKFKYTPELTNNQMAGKLMKKMGYKGQCIFVYEECLVFYNESGKVLVGKLLKDSLDILTDFAKYLTEEGVMEALMWSMAKKHFKF